MGKQDLLAKKYMSDNEKFADVFNYYLYNGKQVIKSENLKEESISEIKTLLLKSIETLLKSV